MNKNVGLFFGTFDPLHNGHIAIAKYFLKELNLDEIWFVITPLSPFKQENKVTSYYDRFKIISNYCKKYSKIISYDIRYNLK
jgi:nicotinate-nucleotide adenylyltransferase